jgi:RIO kinase 1
VSKKPGSHRNLALARRPVELPESFYEDWWITEVLHTVKSGKEATVYCCRAHPHAGGGLLAAKVYRSRKNRGFQNDAVYQEGRVILDSRIRRAFAKKTRMGREFQAQSWLWHEYSILGRLYGVGADVPKPFFSDGDAVLLEYFGGERQPAPMLAEITLERGEAQAALDLLLWNVELMLAHNVVHGDLSPYNVLYWESKPRLIDFPQWIDPRLNRHGYELLLRDVENLCDYFTHCGVSAEPRRFADGLWHRFTHDRLRPEGFPVPV